MRDGPSNGALAWAPAAALEGAVSPGTTSSATATRAVRSTGPDPGSAGNRSRTFVDPAAAGVQRVRIAHRRVRLLSAPDDRRATVLGRLEHGDEVELADAIEGYLLVRNPTGMIGWIRRNTVDHPV